MPSIDDDLSQIERDIRTLKIEYEQYFGGGRKRPPADTQWRLDSVIRRCSEHMGELNYGQRFRYNNLMQTYAKYQDMWRKKIAQKETGEQQRHFGAAAKAIEAERSRAAVAQKAASPDGSSGDRRDRDAHKKTARPETVFALQFDLAAESAGDDAKARLALEHRKIEDLYRKLIEARTETGERAGAPSMHDFQRFVQQKTLELQSKGAHQVEYTVTIEAGRVKLKARMSS